MLTGRLGEGGAYFPEAAARFFDMAAGASFPANGNARIERLRLFPPPF